MTDTDMVLADIDLIKTDTDISVSAKNIGQLIYRSISTVTTNFRVFCHTLTKQGFFWKKWVKNFTLGGGLLIMT